MTKADLIARLEKEGGSRELDAEILVCMYPEHYQNWKPEYGYMEFFNGSHWTTQTCEATSFEQFPHITTSLDVSKGEIRKRWPGCYIEMHEGKHHGEVSIGRIGLPAVVAVCRTLEVAAVIALLRALEDQPATLTGECDG